MFGYTPNTEKEKAFYDRVEVEIKPKVVAQFKEWENEKDFNELSDMGEEFIYVWGSLKLDYKNQYVTKDFYKFCLKSDVTEEQYKRFCKDINTEVEKIAIEMLGQVFRDYHQPYWDFGIKYDSSTKKKKRKVTTKSEEDYKHDPCMGCEACDHSYNCKHCKYGDDGRYESPYDVYTPRELGIDVSW